MQPEPTMSLPRLCLATLLIATPALAADPAPVTDEAAFRAFAIDRSMDFGIGKQVIHADGRVTGTINGPGDFTGIWSWKDSLYCRDLVVAGEQTGEDCMVVEQIGDTGMRMIRARGEGRVYEFTFQ